MSEADMPKNHRRYRLPLLALTLIVCSLLVSGLASAQLPDLATLRGSPLRPTSDWESSIAGIERKYARRDPNQDAIVFIGSSSIVLWNTLQEDFPNRPVINAGFGGSQIIDSVYFADRLVMPFAPHTIVFFAGSNDISAGKQPPQVLADYVAFVERVHAELPQTTILFISISPSPSRWSQHPKVIEANRLIKLYTETDDRLGFIDIYPSMLGPDGTPQVDLYASDNLHLSPKGYELWTEAVLPYLSFPYQRLWLSGPSSVEPVQSPVTIEALVAPDMDVQHVSVVAGSIPIYVGDVPPASPVVSPYLPDGEHQVVLEVTDQHGETWRRTVRIDVRNATILEPTRGTALQDVATFRFTTGYATESLSAVTVSLAPIRLVEVQDAQKVVIYQGKSLPDGLTLDTLTLADGTYELRLVIETVEGHRAEDAHPVVVRNWQVMSDPFAPPQTNGWFGMFDRKRTIFESPGWDYGTDQASAFFGDNERRIWLGDGDGDLIWEVPALDRFRVVLYARDADLSQLTISVSPDQTTWQTVPWESNELDVSAEGWTQIQLYGETKDVTSPRYFRMTLGAGLVSDVIQLGNVELLYPAARLR